MTILQPKLLDYFRGYQRDFILDDSRMIIYLKSRQIGISEAITLKAVREALTMSGRNIYVVSTNLQNAKDLIRRCKRWIDILTLADPALGKCLQLEKDNVQIIEFPNRSRVIALPCKPESVRSISGTIYLDEAAFYPQCGKIWEAIAPAITSNPALKIVLVSTPFGPQGLFHDRYVNGGDKWSRHKTDVYDAVADGFNPEVLDLQAEFTGEAWEQEFCCQFVSDLLQYFKFDLLKKTMTDPAHWATDGNLYMGVDLASERDKSVWVLLREIDQNFFTVGMGYLTGSYPKQHRDLCEIIDSGPDLRGIAVDATGEGKGLSQWLQESYSRRLVHAIHITAPFKAEYVPAMKLDMQAGKLNLSDDPRLYSAFTKVRELTTVHGNRLYKLKRDEAGHADEFVATKLAYSLAKRLKKRKLNPPRSVGKVRSRAQSLYSSGH